MDNSTVCFVGIDYHQNAVQIAVLDAQGKLLRNRRVANSWAAIAEQIPSGSKVAAAIEACTGAADLSEQLIEQAGWDVSMAHAQYVARLKQSPDKSDFSDAQLLADLRRVGYLPRTWLPPKYIRELRRLVRHRQLLADQRRHAKLRIQAIRREHRLNDAPASAWSKPWISWLREHPDLPQTSRWLIEEHFDDLEHLKGKIARAEKKLEVVTGEDAMVARLKSLAGIGKVTAWFLRAMIGQFERFRTAKQLCRYCGLSPRNASSGTRQADAGVVRSADGQLRAVLIQAAHRLIRTEPRWRTMSRQIIGRGKHANVAAVAVANRWMRGVYHQMKKQTAQVETQKPVRKNPAA
jgi:transposase